MIEMTIIALIIAGLYLHCSHKYTRLLHSRFLELDAYRADDLFSVVVRVELLAARNDVQSGQVALDDSYRILAAVSLSGHDRNILTPNVKTLEHARSIIDGAVNELQERAAGARP